jgi:hypothetical protein
MEKLRNKIWELQNENFRHQKFVSEQDLGELLTRDVVYQALSDERASDNCRLEPFHIEQVVDVVVNGGHKVFAILVHIRQTKSIRQFIENDQFQGSGLDRGLPFGKAKLCDILSESVTANEFYEQQWRFVAPKFSESVFTRTLPPEMILPFIKQQPLGEGGFGDVYNIEIASSHQLFHCMSWDVKEVSLRLPNIGKVADRYPGSTERVPSPEGSGCSLRDRAT